MDVQSLLVGHSDQHLGPGHLCHLLLLLKVKQPKEVGDPRVARDVRLPAQVSVSKGGLQIYSSNFASNGETLFCPQLTLSDIQRSVVYLDRDDCQFILVHGLHNKVEPLNHLKI